ncbi:MAG: response regulator transcription factor [Clostridiales bacterium]|nr:response regulator transcription factor [Clostridiales bacterium]MBR6484184.1 response regulator transcription factor [Clostridiales bacterium]
MDKKKVLIVEDQVLVRKFIENALADSDRYEASFSIKNADLADVYCQKNEIDLILMDVYTDLGASGLEAAARIKKQYPEIKIIVITSLPEFSFIKRAREIGVESFMYKEDEANSLISIMDRTMAGESVYPDKTPEVKIGLASSYDFSERELEVLRELTSGNTNEEIAAKLCISTATVKTHIANLMDKTGFKSRTELAIKARELGLVIL